MSKHRFITTEFLKEGALLALNEAESKHAHKVLRLEEGDEIFIVNSQNQRAQARISKISKAEVWVEIGSIETIAPTSQSKVILLQSLLKGPKMDWLIEKATEIGVNEIRPLLTKFTVVREDKIDRWERLAESAMKQSGNMHIPTIHSPALLQELRMPSEPGHTKILLSPAATISLIQILQNCRDTKTSINSVLLAIGPEGGFSADEEAWLQTQGFMPAKMSHNILRGETAGILAAGICRHFLDFS